jgi:hypothetical protein
MVFAFGIFIATIGFLAFFYNVYKHNDRLIDPTSFSLLMVFLVRTNNEDFPILSFGLPL